MTQPPPSESSGPPPAPTPHPPSVLVIDDEMGLRDVISSGLKRRNFDVVTAADGQAGLLLARGRPFDLAVCDIMMPGLDGVSVLETLKQICPSTEVVMMTGYATLETAVESMKRGAYDYITKPFSINNLCSILDRALERRRLKAKVDDLEELNRLKSELLAVVSHELRTPMACFMGFVSLVLSGVYGALQPRQVDPLQRALTSAESLLLLINNILDLSKLTANRMSLVDDVFELRAFSEEVVGAMDPLIERKGLKLTLEAPGALWARTDRTKLKQILINLIGNSIKFTDKGSIVLRVREGSSPRHVHMEVSDTGIGIKKEDLPILFQEFRQVDSSTTRRYGGTGLGLCIVKKTLDLIGGTIQVESEFGSGTTFFMDAPICVSAPAEQESLPDASSKTAALTAPAPGKNIVLCIDDDPMVLKLLSDSLEATDFEFVGAPSGAEGLALARQLHPQIITLDIMMPHMDGWSVLHALKKDPALQSIPVFVVSIVDNKPLAFSLGVKGYLIKPFTRDQLLDALSGVRREQAPHALVVDDDASVRALVSQALKEEGYEVEAIASGEEAVQRLTQIQPALLLLDLVMPRVSGFDVLQAIESQPHPHPDMAVIVMTESDLSREEEAYLKRRVQAILRKKSDHLDDVVRKLKKNIHTARKVA